MGLEVAAVEKRGGVRARPRAREGSAAPEASAGRNSKITAITWRMWRISLLVFIGGAFHNEYPCRAIEPSAGAVSALLSPPRSDMARDA